MLRLVSLVSLVFAWVLAASSAASAPRVVEGLALADPAPTGESGLQAQVVFSSNLLGSFEPCECPEFPLGGIAQLAGTIETLRSERSSPLFLLDSGDRLFRLDMAMTGTEEAERRLKALLLVDSGNAMGLEAFGVGGLDLGAGLAYLQKLERRASFPFLSANLRSTDGELVFAPSVLLERGGRKLGVVAVLPGGLRGDGFTTDDPKAAVRRESKELRSLGAELVVLLSNLGPDSDRKWARAMGVDAILGSRGRELTEEGTQLGRVLRGEAGSRGRYLGELRWYAEGPGKGPHLVATTRPVHAGAAVHAAVDHMVKITRQRLADPVLGVPPIPPPGGLEDRPQGTSAP